MQLGLHRHSQHARLRARRARGIDSPCGGSKEFALFRAAGGGARRFLEIKVDGAN